MVLLVIFTFVNKKQFLSSASPIDSLLAGLLNDDDGEDDASIDKDYDLHYDQRQNGTENYRLKIDGVLLAVPGAASEQSLASLGLLASSYLVNMAEATGGMDDDDDDDEDKKDAPYRFELSDPNIIKNGAEDGSLLAATEENNDDGVQQADLKTDQKPIDVGATVPVEQQQSREKSNTLQKKKNK